jgi:hypothetical protein
VPRDPELAASCSIELRDVGEIWLVRSGNGKTELAALYAADQDDDLVSIRWLPRFYAVIEAPFRHAAIPRLCPALLSLR